MSRVPPPPSPPQQPQDFNRPPFEARPRVPGLAIISFVLGIAALLVGLFLVAGIIGALILGNISLVSGCIAVSGICGVLGIVLGAIANSKISNNPIHLGGKGFALTGLGLGIGGVALTLIVLALLPFFLRAQEISNRSYCAANLTGILKSANVYANDNSDDFPTVVRPTGPMISFAGGNPVGSTPDLAISEIYNRGTQNGNMSSNLWILVLKGYTAPKQYICKTDASSRSVATPSMGGSYYDSFPGVQNISYAQAIPWDSSGNKIGFWKSIVDASLPLMADAPPRNGDSVSGGIVRVEGGPSASGSVWNSPIHNGDGQMVGWSDAHAGFERRPDVGYQNDNIWTQNGGTPSATGMVPTYSSGASTGGFSRSITDYPSGGSAQSWDVYMAPARGTDGKSY